MGDITYVRKDGRIMPIKIYADGACSGNPGNGGYGCIVDYGNKQVEFSDWVENTTNNRMELLGVIVALESIKTTSELIEVYSDSQYVIKGITEWLPNWIKNNWRNSKRQPTPNKDLWLRLMAVSKQFTIKWIWVRGHAGHEENERCDRLAKGAIVCKDVKQM